MVVVVQLLAADQDAPGHDVLARIGHIVIVAVAEEVTDAVDHAGGPERDPDDLRQQDQHAGHDAEQGDVDRAHQEQAVDRVARVNVVFHPVVGRAVTVALHRFLVGRFLHVQEHATPEDPVDAVDRVSDKALWTSGRICAGIYGYA